MTRLPRGLSGRELARKLQAVDYEILHHTGSHIICRTYHSGKHTEPVPDHKELKLGTLSSILARVAAHLAISRDELLDRLGL